MNEEPKFDPMTGEPLNNNQNSNPQPVSTSNDTEAVINGLMNLFQGKELSVERNGNQITFTQDFVDATYLGDLDESILEQRKSTYQRIVTINEDHTYEAHDTLSESNNSMGFSNISGNREFRSGNVYKSGFYVLLGRDNLTGETGIIKRQWSTNEVKEPIKKYLENMGYTNKKAGKSSIGKKLLIIGIIAVVAIIGAVAIYGFTRPKLVCTSQMGNITLRYNDDTIIGYSTSNMVYDVDQQREVVKQIGIEEYLNQFTAMFNQKFSGTCERK